MDELKWMTEISKEFGRKHLPNFTNGIIDIVIGKINTTAEEKVAEVARVLKDMHVVLKDEAFPWDTTDAKKAPLPEEAPKENSHLDCTIDVGKVEDLMKPWTLDEIMRNEG